MDPVQGQIASLEEPRTGALNWDRVKALVKATKKAGAVSEDVKAFLKGRVKSEYALVVLNTLTALHTLALNTDLVVRSQLAASKVLRAAERILNRPQAPGLELAVAQLFFDWCYLYGREDLGVKSYQLLNTGKNKVLLSVMAPSDVVVMLGEDRKIGMPRFGMTKGLNFARIYGDPSLPVPGQSTNTSAVVTALAKQALMPLSGGPIGTQAQLQDTPDEPKTAADKLLASIKRMQDDMAQLAAAEDSCREAAKQPGARQLLARHLDEGYVAACRCANWRSKIQDLVQTGLDDSRVERLLAAADALNTALAAWQAFASLEVFSLVGVDVAARTSTDQQHGHVASGSAGAGTAPDFMDLFTGDTFTRDPTANPFAVLTAATGASAAPGAAPTANQQPQQQHTGRSAASSLNTPATPEAQAPAAQPLDLLSGDTLTAASPHSGVDGSSFVGTLSPSGAQQPNPFRSSFDSSTPSSLGLSAQQHSTSSRAHPEIEPASPAATSSRVQAPYMPPPAAAASAAGAAAGQMPPSSSGTATASGPLQRTSSGDSSSTSSNDAAHGSYSNPFASIDAKLLAAAGVLPATAHPQPMRSNTGGPAMAAAAATAAATAAALPRYSATGSDAGSSSSGNPFRDPATPLTPQQLLPQAQRTNTAAVAALERTSAPAAGAPGSPTTIHTTPFDPFSEEATGTPRALSRLGPGAPLAAAKRSPPAAPASTAASVVPPLPAAAQLAPAAAAGAAMQQPRHPEAAMPAQQQQQHASSSPLQPQPAAAADASRGHQRPLLSQLVLLFEQARGAAGPAGRPGGCCRTCFMPPQQALMTAVHSYVSAMQKHHQAEMQALREAHAKEVEGIKATAVARIKEVMAATGQQQL